MPKRSPMKSIHEAHKPISFKNIPMSTPQTRAVNPKQNKITFKKMNCSPVANWLWMLLPHFHLHSSQAAISGDGIIINGIQ